VWQRDVVAKVPFSGVCLVTRRGSVLASECSGFADRPAGVAWTVDTASQIASISKQFVAVVAVQLADNGTLDLEQPVASLLPEAPPGWRSVTVRQLLTHTSGLPHWCELPGFDPQAVMGSEERLIRLLQAPLARPGATWRYSSPGYILLSAVLERVSGRSYGDLARDVIVDRVPLPGTTIGHEPSTAPARGYRAGEPVAPWDLSRMPGTGDVWSTARDVAAFVTAVHTGALLSSAAQHVLRGTSVPTRSSDDGASRVTTNRYALGHFIGSVNGHPARLHPGDNPGYQALAAWLPAPEVAVAVLSNDETDDLSAVLSDSVADLD
jgi:CubicO group peptidase (beta-lactamase class C family)